MTLDGFHASGTRTTTLGGSWNGPICGVCDERYLGWHDCKGHQCDATRKLERLRDFLATEGIDFDEETA